MAVSNEMTMDQTANFEALLEESLGTSGNLEGKVLKGCIIAIDNEFAVIDVGLKSEGRIPLREFGHDESKELKVGDIVDVFLERMEDNSGETLLSREKARREEGWEILEKICAKAEPVMGTIVSRVKGGFTVDVHGALAFLPGSQVDIRPIQDASPLIGVSQPFMILKMDRPRGNIVVSRRAVLEESREEARSELLANIKEGNVLEGIVKNITDYGAFIDLGGVDGLLHSSDISWNRIGHPSDVLKLGQTIKVQVIRYNEETKRVSLGMKQLDKDPWDHIESEYPVGKKVMVEITNITEYGAFAKLKPSGIEGLIHSSEISWTKKNTHPGKFLSTSQEVEVVVIGIDRDKRRISLSLKQCATNPWHGFQAKFKPGDIVEGEVKNITEFGLFVGLEGDIDGMIHMSDLDWSKSGEEAIKNYKKADIIKVKILDIDVDKERISLGVKQLENDPFESSDMNFKKGDVVTCTIMSLTDGGIEVEISEGIVGFIKKADLSRERSEQRTDRFAVGEKVDAKITQFDKRDRKLGLSIKAREMDEEKQAMADYGSSDSGASLGDILGAALQKADQAKKASDEKGKK